MEPKDGGSRIKNGLSLLLSLWIVYHLIVIVIMPNSGSFLLRQLGAPFLSYANILGLNTSWNFFSPDPAHVMYFQYTVTRKDQISEEDTEPYYIPPEKNRGPFGNTKRRIMYSMRYMILDHRRVDALLGPWLCRRHPEAFHIHVEHKIESIPPIDEAVYQTDAESSKAGPLIKMVDKDFNCQDLDEVNL